MFLMHSKPVADQLTLSRVLACLTKDLDATATDGGKQQRPAAGSVCLYDFTKMAFLIPNRWLIIGNCLDSLVLISWFWSERNPTVSESDLDCLIDVLEVFQAADF
jgi:hypothetical protein